MHSLSYYPVIVTVIECNKSFPTQRLLEVRNSCKSVPFNLSSILNGINEMLHLLLIALTGSVLRALFTSVTSFCERKKFKYSSLYPIFNVKPFTTEMIP